MPNIVVPITASEEAALLDVTGQTPLVFFNLRLQDAMGAYARKQAEGKAELIALATPAEKTQLDTLFAVIAARRPKQDK